MVMVLKILAGLAGVAIVVAAGTFYFACPCERIPGGPLSGAAVSEPVSDWSRANDAGLCQLEVQGIIPWSINLNCMAADGALYVSCARCAGKAWSNLAVADPRGRIRIGDAVYPVSLQRIVDPATLDVAWAARAAKTGRPVQPRPDHWWSFKLASASP